MKKWLLIPIIFFAWVFSSIYSTHQAWGQQQSQEMPSLDLTKPGPLQVPSRRSLQPRLRHAFGLKLGYFVPTANDGFQGIEEDDFNDIFFGAELDLSMSPNFYVTPGIGYYKGDTTPSPSLSTSDIELTIVPILLSLKYVSSGTTKLYLGGGIGLYDWSVDKTSVIDSPVPLLLPEVDDGTEFGFHFLGGFVAPISRGTGFMGEIQFHIVEADTAVTKLDLGGFNFNFGFLFFF